MEEPAALGKLECFDLHDSGTDGLQTDLTADEKQDVQPKTTALKLIGAPYPAIDNILHETGVVRLCVQGGG